MTDFLKKITIFSVFIGVIALGLNLMFGEGTITYINKMTIEGDTYYYFNFWNYISNLKISFQDTSILQFKLPTRQWENDVTGFADIGNNLAVLVNYVIMILNLLLYPFKLTGYLIQVVLGILGVDITNTQSNIYWLVEFTQITKTIYIPYI